MVTIGLHDLLFVIIISLFDCVASSGQWCYTLTGYFGMSELQVWKAYFELVDYLEADRAFSLARHASPHSLEGMDVYSTVLYVSVLFIGILNKLSLQTSSLRF